MLLRWFGTRALILLIAVGLIDLTATAILYSLGIIEEMNPLMAVFLHVGVWAFIVAKGSTLAGATLVLRWHARKDVAFVRNACLAGSSAYVFIWVSWVVAGTLR